MIKSVNLQRVTHEDFYQIMSLVIAFLKKENLEELKLTDLAAAFEKAFEALDKAFKQARKTGLVSLKDEIDVLRDDLVIGWAQTVLALLRFPDADIKAAAQRIANAFEKYGGSAIATLPQKDETAAVTNLLQDVDEKDLVATDTKRWADRLRAENTRFAEVLAQKVEKDAEYIAGLLTDERKKTDTQFRQLCKGIDALAFLNGEAPYQNLANNINQLVADAQSAVKQKDTLRETLKKKKEEGGSASAQ